MPSIRISEKTLILIRALKGHYQQEQPDDNITDDKAINISLRLVAYGVDGGYTIKRGVLKCQKKPKKSSE